MTTITKYNSIYDFKNHNSKWELAYTINGGDEKIHEMTYTVPTHPDGSFVDMTLESKYYKDLFKTAKRDIANRTYVYHGHDQARLDKIDIKWHVWVE